LRRYAAVINRIEVLTFTVFRRVPGLFRAAVDLGADTLYGAGAMARPILDEAHIHEAIRETVSTKRTELVTSVQNAIATHDIVVVGMAQNPFPKKARRLLKEQGLPFEYLEYGNYLKEWRNRNALKMWTGWPTFPMIFVKGTLIGGFTDLKALVDAESLTSLLSD
jgi:monothiol glutaredoxin